MTNETESYGIKQSKRKRLEFIESRLFWEEKISRTDLVDYFNISIPQATNDLKEYTELFPQNIMYDKSQKIHLMGGGFVPKLTNPNSDDYRKQLLVHSVESDKTFYYGNYPSFQNFHELNRPVDAIILKKVSMAINHKQVIFIKYHSIKRGICERSISPHALVYDGSRLHLRAYCYTNVQFRDFNLGRIIEIGNTTIDSNVDFELDYHWTSFIDAIIKPHPDFNKTQKECIEHEYDMTDERRIFSVRGASVFYFYRRYGFDIKNYDDPKVIKMKRQQVVLDNKDEIDMKIKLLEEMSMAKLKEANYSINLEH